MAIQFNNIPTTTRTPGAYVEVDNSRALKGLLANPYKVLIIGQMIVSPDAGYGTALRDTLYQITRDGLADGYFGSGSILTRMCNTFKKNNPNTDLYAIAVSNPAGGVAASATLHFSVALSSVSVLASGLSGTEQFNLFVNGIYFPFTLTSGWSTKDINSTIQSTINATTWSGLPVKASTTATSALNFVAVQLGEQGNYLDVRMNFYEGQSNPTGFVNSVLYSTFAGGVGSPTISDEWGVIDGEQFQIIIEPYIDVTNLKSVEDELASRFKPLVDQWGHCITAARGALASLATLGLSRNCTHLTIVGEYDSPTSPEEWAAAWGAEASYFLNDDPSRPLQYLPLSGIVAPMKSSRFTRAERDILLYDGIATWLCDTVGNVMMERSITTYKVNAVGLPDYSYLDIETLATLAEIRFQFKTRMTTRFVIPRYKLADDSFAVPPGAYIVTPKTIKQEIISLFSLLRDKGLVENLDDFIKNLLVERDASDVNRINVLLPPDLVNQFRILAGIIQFIL